MSRTADELSDEEALVLENYVAAALDVSEKRSDSQAQRARPSVTELVRYAYDIGYDDDGKIDRAIGADERTGRQWDSVLAHMGVESFHEAIAAADDDLIVFHTDVPGETLEVRPSTSEPDVWVLVLRLSERRSTPPRSLRASSGKQSISRSLPDPFRGVLQLDIPKDDPLLAVLRAEKRRIEIW